MVTVAVVGEMGVTLGGPVKLQIMVSETSLNPSCKAETEKLCIPFATPGWKVKV